MTNLAAPVVHAIPDTGGPVATNDGSSPTDRPPCPSAATLQTIKPASMHKGRSSWVIRTDLACDGVRAGDASVRECQSHAAFRIESHPTAALACRESWRGSGCASGFMAATVRRNDFPRHCVPSSRNKIAAPPGPPLRCGRYAVQPARTSPFGSPTRPRWARP